METKQMGPVALTRREVAGELRISLRTVDRLIQRGDLAAFYVGKSVRIPRYELDRLTTAK